MLLCKFSHTRIIDTEICHAIVKATSITNIRENFIYKTECYQVVASFGHIAGMRAHHLLEWPDQSLSG
jgi:hypothetical protein